MIVRDPAANGGMLYEVYFDLELIKIVSSQLYFYFLFIFILSWLNLIVRVYFCLSQMKWWEKNIWNTTCIWKVMEFDYLNMV